MKDELIRAIGANGAVRVFVAYSKEMVQQARTLHHTSPVATAALGRLLTAGCMMGSTLKGDKDLITLQIRGDGPLQGIVVTADQKGRAKGYVFQPNVDIPSKYPGKLDVSGAIGKGSLRIIKDIGMKEPYSGEIALISGEIAEDLTYYFATSEQVPSAVGLGVLMEKDNTVKQAGGFIIQLMPSAEDEVISVLEEKLKSMDSVTNILNAGNTPEQLLEILLGDLGLEITDTIPATYYCDCSRERVERAIISIGKKDIQEMIDDGKPVEVRCQFCNNKYEFETEDLKHMLDKARA